MTEEKKEQKTPQTEKPKEKFKKPNKTDLPEGKVAVKKDFLKRLQETMARQEKQIGMLTEIADKKNLAKWKVKNKEKLPTEVRIRCMNVYEKDEKTGEENPVKKAIVGWRTTRNEVMFDPVARKGYEDQRVEVLFEDGTKKEMKLLEFNNAFEYIKCQRIGQEVDDMTGQVAYRLQRMDNGEILTIGVAYVN